MASAYPFYTLKNQRDLVKEDTELAKSALASSQAKLNTLNQLVPKAGHPKKIEETLVEVTRFLLMADTNYKVAADNFNTQAITGDVSENGSPISMMFRTISSSPSTKMIPASIKGGYADYVQFRQFLSDLTEMSVSIKSLQINNLTFFMEVEIYGK